MALNSFALSGGGNVTVGTTPVGIQVTGPTVVITNLGQNTVFGSCGGSATSTVGAISGFVTGLPAPAGAAGSSNAGGAGIAVPASGSPGSQVVIATGGNGWLWLQTLQGTSSVNVANGT